jgi:cysteine dioxygenase
MKTTEITTIKELIETLKNKGTDSSYLKIMKAINIPLSEFENFYTWSDEHYTRNCLVRTDEFELMLICWEKGQQSPIHDFASNEAWIHTIHGKLTEERFLLTKNSLEKVSSVTLGTSEFSYMKKPISIHRYINSYESRTVSLNLYAKPVKTRQEYNEETKEVTQKTVSCDKVFEFDENGNACNS